MLPFCVSLDHFFRPDFPGVPSVTIHYERNVSWNFPRFQNFDSEHLG